MSAIQAAMRKAGIITNAERLREAARDAVARSNRDYEAARDLLFEAVQNDAGLLWEMFAPFRADAARRVLQRAFNETREIGGHVNRDIHRSRAADAGAGHGRRDNQLNTARPRAPNVSAIRAAGAMVARSILDAHMTALGKPLGDCSRDELLALAKRSRRDAKLYEFCASGLPPTGVLRDYRKPEEVEALMRAAEKENHDA